MALNLFRKSPYTLPSNEYGGGRKRIFIGLLVASCITLCLLFLIFLILPWIFDSLQIVAIKDISIVIGILGIVLLVWLCLTLIFHVYTGYSLPGISSVHHLLIRFFLPLMEILGKFFGIEKDKVRRSFIKVNNELVLAQHKKPIESSKLLLLLPHCIQSSKCVFRLSNNINNCKRCGQCQMGSLLEIRDKYGLNLAIATGGTIARKIVINTKPKFIVAVACERDLTSGIQDSYPLSVFGLLNERPFGPCLDTCFAYERLESIIRHFLGITN